MKKLKQISVSVALTFMLASGTFAGIIHTPAPAPPPPDQPSAMSPGEISTPRELQNPQATSDSVEDIALNLLQTILAMF